MDLEGSTVLLTGASGGIGKAIARALHARGAEALLSARRAGVLEELRAELGDRARVLEADLAGSAAAAELAERAGRVDVLVANAGLPAAGRIGDFTAEEIDRALDVNLRAPVQLAHALLPAMLERGRGHLVFVSSLNGKASSVRSSLYSATKFGLRGFAAGLREDLHGTGVGVTTVFPGFIRDAGMFAESGAKLPPGVGTKTPEEVAAAVVRGIEEDRAEIDVAPIGLRVGVLAASIAPTTMARVQRRLGSVVVADSIAEGQKTKR
ncbi:MAG TPA: SDR family NAD(P)-dependent oxidoreductase [Thermoleophilaceae bacterium]